ncbi:MAG: hypothetical protein CLLPBCKN_004603 [Chroococcidiopsis cubana SAG 39.79]|nr:hypothetical protein [Chroococcidiopsis cubana SAG 39.79]
MMVGLPIVGLATTELATVVENGISGYIDTDLDRLIEQMRSLIANPDLAHCLSAGARQQAQNASTSNDSPATGTKPFSRSSNVPCQPPHEKTKGTRGQGDKGTRETRGTREQRRINTHHSLTNDK